MNPLPLFVALRVLAVPLATHALPLQGAIVQPATYRSASGEFELFVDPSHRRGAGPTSYRLTRVPDECPGDTLAFDGRSIVLLARRELWVLPVEGAYAGRAPLPEALTDPRDVFFSPDGTELWVFTRPEPLLQRFAVPER